METPDNTTGIPTTPNGIPEGSILSPIQLQDLGEDEGGFFDTDGGMGVRRPSPDDDYDGGDEVEEDEDDHNDSNTGFGIGIGLLSTLFMRPASFLPV